jgi:hypothetical protein
MDARTDEDLLTAFDRGCRGIAAATASLLEIVGRLDEREDVDDPNVPDLASHLADRAGVSSATASEWVRVGRALRRLPSIRGAHAEGHLSWDQVRALTRFVTPEEDEAWARGAVGMRPHRLHLEARRRLRRKEREEAESDHALRRLSLLWDDDRRFLYLEGCLASEQGAAVEAALERAAQRVAVEDRPLDRRGARLADALEALVAGGSEGGGPEPALVVHTDAAVLAGGGPGRAETNSGIQLADQAVRRLACHARVRWVKEEEGQPVAIGRGGRAVGGALSDLVRHRDRTCRFGGCDRTWFLHVHHIRPWARGGRTTLENLVLLCGTHHRMLHEGGWSIRGDPNGDLEFLGRKGHVIGRSSIALPVARAAP